jgi:hypothetical protein
MQVRFLSPTPPLKGNYMATKPKKPMPDDDKGKKPGKKPYK